MVAADEVAAIAIRHVPRTVQTACDPGLARLEESLGLDVGTDPDPIWDWGHTGLHLFPSAMQMAAFLLTVGGRDLLRGRQVLELGCGVGLLGPVAILAGATSITLTDFDPLVLDLCKHNRELNSGSVENMHERIKVQSLDWRHVRYPPMPLVARVVAASCEEGSSRSIDDIPRDPELEASARATLQGVDIILATDVVYDEGLSHALVRVLVEATDLNQDAAVLLGVQYREDDPSKNNSSTVERLLDSVSQLPRESANLTGARERSRSPSRRLPSADGGHDLVRPRLFEAEKLAGAIGLQLSEAFRRVDEGGSGSAGAGAGAGTMPSLEVWLLRRRPKVTSTHET